MHEDLNKKEQLWNTSDFNFLSNNVKGLQSSKKRLKLFQYFKNKISPKGILFLQETHSSKVTEKHGVINLMVTYSSRMGKQILAVL